jgi:hypothetical protein
MPDQDLLSKLQAENARLIALLQSHGIEWRSPPLLLLRSSAASRLPGALSCGDGIFSKLPSCAPMSDELRQVHK